MVVAHEGRCGPAWWARSPQHTSAVVDLRGRARFGGPGHSSIPQYAFQENREIVGENPINVQWNQRLFYQDYEYLLDNTSFSAYSSSGWRKSRTIVDAYYSISEREQPLVTRSDREPGLARRNAREQSLQALRFVAAGLVLATHITFYLHERLDPGLRVWQPGVSGVGLFFVISGYVMMTMGAKLGDAHAAARSFLARRLARIFPAYWIVTTLKIAIVISAPSIMVHHRPEFLYSLGSYLLVPMFDDAGEVRPIHGVGWTLLHEMLFYYLFGLALLLKSGTFRTVTISLVGLCLAGLAVHTGTALQQVACNPINLLFVGGMALHLLRQRGVRFGRLGSLSLVTIGLGTMLMPAARELRIEYLGAFDAPCILVVAGCFELFGGLGRSFAAALAGRLGDSSYSLYLIHPLLAPALCVAAGRLCAGLPYSTALVFLGAFALTVAAGHIFYVMVERPLVVLATSLLKFQALGARARPKLATW